MKDKRRNEIRIADVQLFFLHFSGDYNVPCKSVNAWLLSKCVLINTSMRQDAGCV